MKRYIKFMAKPRREIISDLEQNFNPCIEHLAKLYLFPNGPVDHWRKEVWAYYESVSKMKPKNKTPNAEFIFENTWEFKKHLVQTITKNSIHKVNSLYPDEDRLNDLDTLYAMMESYFIWLSIKLSKDEVVLYDDCIDKLIELGF